MPESFKYRERFVGWKSSGAGGCPRQRVTPNAISTAQRRYKSPFATESFVNGAEDRSRSWRWMHGTLFKQIRIVYFESTK
jgi:hypothetical protein